MDIVHAAAKKVDHDRWTWGLGMGGVILGCVLFLVISGCQVKTFGLKDASVKATLAQVQAEAVEMRGEIAIIRAELDAREQAIADGLAIREQDAAVKEARKQAVLTAIASAPALAAKVATGQPVDWVGLLSSGIFAGAIGGAIGLKKDNNRKDVVILAKPKTTA